MEDLRLFLVYHIGGGPCWQLRVARNSEEALFQCFEGKAHASIEGPQQSCRVEEAKVPGYEILVRPKA